MNNKEKHSGAYARYASVAHLSIADAAKALNCAKGTVRGYRRTHPELAPQFEPMPKAALPTPPKGTIQHAVATADPSRSSSASSVPIMRVTLPAPPWGGGFDRNGVSA